MVRSQFTHLDLPADVRDVLTAAPSVMVVDSLQDIEELIDKQCGKGTFEVCYDVPGKGRVVEATVCRVKNGVAANYPEAYMRRRDPDCMYIADDGPTNKPKFKDVFGREFADLRTKTFAWLKTQPLATFAFYAGQREHGTPSLVICPANASFFAMGLAMLQGIVPSEEIPEGTKPASVIYVAPPFRHTHFAGKQGVVHNRLPGLHELFSYNLYPGPSAKKGIYGVLINIGEQEGWVTAHCSTAQVVTPYDNIVTFMHEGASGGGKSEMLEHVHRAADGRLLLGHNTVTGENRYLTLPHACVVKPVCDDMALCHPALQGRDGKLALMDAEHSWFVRVNHITNYGTDPHLEKLTINQKDSLLFLNIESQPGSTALIWEHIQDSPGKRCPNPRVIVPRSIVPDVVDGAVDVDVRSFGVRTPPCTKQKPAYGILGLLHILPPSLAWLWRLAAPRGHDNPSIVGPESMSSEGVGSYWPFATGRRVDQANLLLEQIRSTPRVRYILCPNQHVGAWKVSFMPQWLTREYLARRGGAKFRPDQLEPARCPLLGYTIKSMQVEGVTIPHWFLRVHTQPEVGEEAYDVGCQQLRDFFREQLSMFLEDDILPLGRDIIQCCLDGGTVADYEKLIASK